jgi:hypothetical protein
MAEKKDIGSIGARLEGLVFIRKVVLSLRGTKQSHVLNQLTLLLVGLLRSSQ